MILFTYLLNGGQQMAHKSYLKINTCSQWAGLSLNLGLLVARYFTLNHNDGHYQNIIYLHKLQVSNYYPI